jgi:arginyl-tRNA synthetase
MPTTLPAAGNPHQNPERFNAEAGEWHGIYVPALPKPTIEVTFLDPDTLPPLDGTGMPVFRAIIQDTVDIFTAELANVGPDVGLTVMKPPANLKASAHLAIPAHKLDKLYGQSAMDGLTEEIQADFARNAVNALEVEGSFINIRLDEAVINRRVLSDIDEYGDNYGSNDTGSGKLVVVDLSSPNIAKQMHVGHLRSTVIGESLSRILKFNGYDVVRDNHVGDWGTQFGLLGRAVELWGSEVEEYLQSPDNARQIEGLLKLYVRINTQIAEEKEASVAHIAAQVADGTLTEKEAEPLRKEQEHSELQDAGREWFVKLEAGDTNAVDFWKWSSDLSMLEFDEVYDKLGSKFEYVMGESVYEHSNQSVITAFKEAGLTYVDDKGVVKIKPSKKKGDALGIQKPDGSSLYGTRDLATIAARMRWFKPDKIVYVVGGDQNEYFINLFDGMHQYIEGKGEQLDLVHVSFGAVELPEGPMSTRKGNVVALRDVISGLEDKVRPKVTSNMEQRGIELEPNEIEHIVGKVAVGSLVYYDLKGSTKRKIVYDPEEVTSFEGNSGASLQYAVARINSLLSKAEYVPSSVDHDAFDGSHDVPEHALLEQLGYFPDAVKAACEKYEPSIVSEYLVRVTSLYNGLLEKTRILDNPDAKKRKLLLQVSAATRQVLTNGLGLLSIPIVEKM